MIQYVIILIFSGICIRRYRIVRPELHESGVDEEGGEQLVLVMAGRMPVNNTIVILHSISNRLFHRNKCIYCDFEGGGTEHLTHSYK